MEQHTWIAAASLIVSITAIYLSIRSNHRAQVTTRAQIFLALRTRFLEVLQALPDNYVDADWSASTPEDKAAAIRYWHHTFDEWYITNKMNRRLMFDLWQSFYSIAILDGMKHKGLRMTLMSMVQQGPGLPQHFPEFANELHRIWSQGHPEDGSVCPGFECEHVVQTGYKNTSNE
jgi:triacylglycerol esterase/lipase EstA (alpha/beta hydrolase family)